MRYWISSHPNLGQRSTFYRALSLTPKLRYSARAHLSRLKLKIYIIFGLRVNRMLLRDSESQIKKISKRIFST